MDAIARLKLMPYQRLAEIIADTFKSKGFVFFDNGDYNVNIVGIRNESRVSGKWDDLFIILFKTGGLWSARVLSGTTDPGEIELKNPSFLEGKRNGVAIVAPGQYRGLWKIGKHHQFDALVQVGNVKLYRDGNRDAVIDLDPKTLGSYGIGTGINFHGFWNAEQYATVLNWSAGCQVPSVNMRGVNWRSLMDVFATAAKRYGNSFTYTLLDVNEVVL